MTCWADDEDNATCLDGGRFPPATLHFVEEKSLMSPLFDQRGSRDDMTITKKKCWSTTLGIFDDMINIDQHFCGDGYWAENAWFRSVGVLEK
jgi:hypothetical protein